MDDRVDTLDVDAPGRDVGRDQGLHPAGGELAQRPCALVLAPAAVDGRGRDTGPIELAGQPVAAVAGPAEDDGTAGRSDGVGRHADALGSGHVPEHVVGCDHVGGLLADLTAHRLVLVFACERRHVTVEGGREQHRLAVGGGLVEQAPHSRDETHVGHTVGLVDDDGLDRAQADHALLDQILEASGARHQDVDAPAEGLHLAAVSHAAVDDRDAHASREGSQLGHDLVGKLAGGGQNERGRPVGPSPHGGGHERDPEGQGLARPGRSAAADVVTGHGVGHRGRLDVERLGDAALVKGAAYGLGYAQLGEGGGHCSPCPRAAGVSWVRRCRGETVRGSGLWGLAHDDRKNQHPLCEPPAGQSRPDWPLPYRPIPVDPQWPAAPQTSRGRATPERGLRRRARHYAGARGRRCPDPRRR